MPRKKFDDDDRLMLSAKIAFAGFLAVVLTLLLVVAFIAPIFVDHYHNDPLVVVPIVTSFLGAILMLVGIRSRLWKDKD